MLSFVYLGALLISIAGMTLLDRRYKLAYFKHTKAAAISVASGTIIFIIWDILGINLGIFFSGQSAYMTGLYLAPEFPIEEIFFLYFLCYFTLITYRLLEVKWPRI